MSKQLNNKVSISRISVHDPGNTSPKPTILLLLRTPNSKGLPPNDVVCQILSHVQQMSIPSVDILLTSQNNHQTHTPPTIQPTKTQAFPFSTPSQKHVSPPHHCHPRPSCLFGHYEQRPRLLFHKPIRKERLHRQRDHRVREQKCR